MEGCGEGRGGLLAWEIVRQRGKWTKRKKGHVDKKHSPLIFFVESLGFLQTVLEVVFFFTQEGGADVPESRLAVSLFSFCYPVPGSPALPRRSLTRRWRFLFFLRVGLQQEGHLQASSK